MKHEARHQAMSFMLAGIVATMVLASFKVCSFLGSAASSVLLLLPPDFSLLLLLFLSQSAAN